MSERQLTLFDTSATIRVGNGGAPGDDPWKRFAARRNPPSETATISCPLCAKYYANWLREMNIHRRKLLSRIHRGGHAYACKAKNSEEA